MRGNQGHARLRVACREGRSVVDWPLSIREDARSTSRVPSRQVRQSLTTNAAGREPSLAPRHKVGTVVELAGALLRRSLDRFELGPAAPRRSEPNMRERITRSLRILRPRRGFPRAPSTGRSCRSLRAAALVCGLSRCRHRRPPRCGVNRPRSVAASSVPRIREPGARPASSLASHLRRPGLARATLGLGAVPQRLELPLETMELFVREVLHVHELGSRRFHGAYQLVELELHDL